MADAMIATPAGQMPAYVAIPAGSGPWPGVVVNDHDPADQTLLLVVLAKASGTRYHEPSARDAHQRIAAFFHRHLTT